MRENRIKPRININELLEVKKNLIQINKIKLFSSYFIIF